MSNIVQVYPSHPVFTVVCCKCGSTVRSDSGRLFADLDGGPFRAYLCRACAIHEGAEFIVSELIEE
jgi:hypothetical protein